VEQSLASKAARLPFGQLVKVVSHEEARLHPAGVGPKEEEQRAARALTLRQDPTGMFHLKGTLDPETGAPVKTAFDAYVAARLRQTRGNNHPDTPGTTDATAGTAPDQNGSSIETRTIPQLQADALADFARHVLACDTTVPVVPAVTMVVRMDLADLQGRDGGAGYATIDGVDHPISAGAARRLACEAGLIPAVFGGASLPLDLGRRSRAFTRAQVLALWERDGGCAFCGQTTFVEAHHIRWWHKDHGTTDLSNGVLLCSRCHHLIHRDGWHIKVSETGEVSFTPPRQVDPDRVPRPAAPNPRRLSAPPATPPSRPPDRDDTRRPPDRPPGRPDPTGPTATTRHGWRIRRCAWRDHPTAETLRALLE
ncbi:MAG: HNH endonuclease, partial [Actinobacteria bacterium]|nr:HNH endonuclease [Actinomycetota bacterium]